MKPKLFLMSAAVVALVAGGALAQDAATGSETPAAPGVATLPAETPVLGPDFVSIEEMTVRDVLGMVAYDPNGDRIGEIDYVIAGMGGPEAVIGIGGFLGLGEYTVALPLSEFVVREDGRTFEVDTDRERLEQMPEFDESGAESLPDDILIATLLSDTTSGETKADDVATDGDEASTEGQMADEAPGEETSADSGGNATTTAQ